MFDLERGYFADFAAVTIPRVVGAIFLDRLENGESLTLEYMLSAYALSQEHGLAWVTRIEPSGRVSAMPLSALPEPTSLLLFGTGLLFGLLLYTMKFSSCTRSTFSLRR